MRHPNLTPIQIGMTGTFAGQSYRVAGRVVLSVDVDGETYYWNEFNLVAPDGREATLVHEQGERGAEWRLFTLIEPSPVLSRAEAEQKSAGDAIEFRGRQLPITLVDESRVCLIEGQAPEGVELGDVAHYFNAQSGNEMIVVSWTGEEVEFYRGVNVPAHGIKQAFNLASVPLDMPAGDSSFESSGPPGWVRFIKPLMGILVAGFLFSSFFGVRCNRSSAPAPPKLAKAQFAIGQVGTVQSVRYRITGRAAVEIGHVGKRYFRHEYAIVDEERNVSLLVQGTEKSDDQWLLLTPFTPEHPLQPREAGASKLGQLLPLQKPGLTVTAMFHTRVQQVEGMSPTPAGVPLYGLIARDGDKTVAVRWTESAITFYRVAVLPAKDVVVAFR